MSTVIIDRFDVGHLVEGLLGRDVTIDVSTEVVPHPATYRGLVTDQDELVAVLGSDISFAHRSAAALAMIPIGRVEDVGDNPEPDFLEIYSEIANVLSRVVNEAMPSRVRLDPGIDHPTDDVEHVISNGQLIFGATVSIAGYGSGSLGIWHLAAASEIAA